MILNIKNGRSRHRSNSSTLQFPSLWLLFLWFVSICIVVVIGVNGNDDDDDDTTTTIATVTLSQFLPFTRTTQTPLTSISPALLFSTTSKPQPIFKFKHRTYNVTIPENSVGKTYAVQPAFEDIMGIWHTNVLEPSELDVKYRIIYGDKDKLFKAEDRTVGDFTFLAIRTRTGNIILNREKIDQYHLKIRATITRRDAKSKTVTEDECQVNVNVLDTNDLSPFFYPNEYSVSVPEDTAIHQSIVKVMAEDADLGINGEIYYSFLEDNDWFSVHPTSGVVTLTRPLKYIDKSLHELVVIATDRGGIFSNRLSQPSKAKVKIRVKQVSICFDFFFLYFIRKDSCRMKHFGSV